MVRRVPRLLSMEWPPSTPIRLAVLFMLKASRMSAEHRRDRRGGITSERSGERESLTGAAGGKRKDLWVFLTHPVNHVDLLQRLSDSVFVLGVAVNES